MVCADVFHRDDDPFGSPLLDRMRSVAGGRLKELSKQTVRVPREDFLY